MNESIDALGARYLTFAPSGRELIKALALKASIAGGRVRIALWMW